jgi:hypothetical protein
MPDAHVHIAITGAGLSGLGMIEAQIAYLRYRRDHGLATLEPSPHAQAAYVAELDRDTEGSVWTAGGCPSWYVDGTGRTSTLWPGSVRAYQRRLARFEIGDYETELPRRLPEREPVAV